MHQRHRLAILREESSIRNVHHLQNLGIVADLQGHGIDILCPCSSTLTVNVEPGGCVRWPDQTRSWLSRPHLRCGCAGGCSAAAPARPPELLRLPAPAAEPGWRAAIRWRSRCLLPGLLVQVGHISRPDDVRNQGEDNLVFLVLDVALGKEVFQDRNLRQPGIPLSDGCPDLPKFRPGYSLRLPSGEFRVRFCAGR